MEGGQVEGGAGSQAGSRPENRASVQAGGRAGIHAASRARHRVDRVGGLGQGRARPGSGVRTSSFFGAALARRFDKCNARWGFLESSHYNLSLVLICKHF